MNILLFKYVFLSLKIPYVYTTCCHHIDPSYPLLPPSLLMISFFISPSSSSSILFSCLFFTDPFSLIGIVCMKMLRSHLLENRQLISIDNTEENVSPSAHQLPVGPRGGEPQETFPDKNCIMCR